MVEYDVFVTYRAPAGTEVARQVEAALQGRGFRVYATPLEPVAVIGDGLDHASDALGILEQCADFVAIVTPDALHDYMRPDTTLGTALDRAITRDLNIVPVVLPGVRLDTDGGHTLAGYQPIAFAPHAPRESLARIAHRLSSAATLDERHAGRQTRWMVATVAMVLLALAASAIPRLIGHYTYVKPLPPLTLSTAAFAERQQNGEWTAVPLAHAAPVANGDQVRLAFSVNGDGYAYVVAEDVRGDVSIVFPSRALKGGSRVRAGEIYEVPASGGWLNVDAPVALQALYVVASYDAIESLESIVEEREGESTPQDRAAALQTTIDGLLDGKHAVTGSTPRTRKGQSVLQTVEAPSPSRSAYTAALSSGATVTQPMVSRTGLLSVMSEIRLRPALSSR